MKLKNGIEVSDALGKIVYLSLMKMSEENPYAFYELVTLCRQPEYTPPPSDREYLKKLNLLKSDGQPHADTRAVVLAAVEGDGLEMRLVNPIK